MYETASLIVANFLIGLFTNFWATLIILITSTVF